MTAKRKKKQQPNGNNSPRPLLYKVVELSTVDESALERTVNEWSSQGWKLDGVQFAMRESSKRPSMAFVFFTREGPVATASDDEVTVSGRVRSLGDAERKLRHLADDDAAAPPPVSAWERLAQLAGDDDL